MRLRAKDVERAAAAGDLYPKVIVEKDGVEVEVDDDRTASRHHQRLNAEAGPGRADHRKNRHAARHTFMIERKQAAYPLLRGFSQQRNAPDPIEGDLDRSMVHSTNTPIWMRKAKRRAAAKRARASRKVNR